MILQTITSLWATVYAVCVAHLMYYCPCFFQVMYQYTPCSGNVQTDSMLLPAADGSLFNITGLGSYTKWVPCNVQLFVHYYKYANNRCSQHVPHYTISWGFSVDIIEWVLDVVDTPVW